MIEAMLTPPVAAAIQMSFCLFFRFDADVDDVAGQYVTAMPLDAFACHSMVSRPLSRLMLMRRCAAAAVRAAYRYDFAALALRAIRFRGSVARFDFAAGYARRSDKSSGAVPAARR